VSHEPEQLHSETDEWARERWPKKKVLTHVETGIHLKNILLTEIRHS
jgi:hypothetical protein